MAFTEVSKNYSFHAERLSDYQVRVTNNTDRTLLHLELVYLNGYFGEVLEMDGIAADASGMINIDPFRVIRTTQVADAQDFTPGDIVWFQLQDDGDGNNGELLDDTPSSVGTQVAVGMILEGAENDYVVFRPFIQDIDFSLVRDDGGLVAACVSTTDAIKVRLDTAEVNPVRTVALVVDEAANDDSLAFPNADTGLGAGDTIIDVHIVCTDSAGSGTLTLHQVGSVAALGNAISSDMASATANALARTTSIDQAENEVTAHGLAVVGAGENDRGIVYVTYIKA